MKSFVTQIAPTVTHSEWSRILAEDKDLSTQLKYKVEVLAEIITAQTCNDFPDQVDMAETILKVGLKPELAENSRPCFPTEIFEPLLRKLEILNEKPSDANVFVLHVIDENFFYVSELKQITDVKQKSDS